MIDEGLTILGPSGGRPPPRRPAARFMAKFCRKVQGGKLDCLREAAS